VPRLERADVACWLIKTARMPPELGAGEALLDRCLRTSYRLNLLRPGDPCVLWRSGTEDPGVCAVGAVAGEVEEFPGGPVVAVRMRRLPAPVARADLLADPAFRDAEVLRMPAGSNPSWLSARQFAAVLARLRGDALGAPGSMDPCEATGSGGERSAGC
jgi:hypothetical protein